MRLPKTLYFIEEEKTIVGHDSLGRPIYDTVTTYDPFKGEVEPFSAKLAETQYGLFVEVTNRVFCLPNSKIKIQAPVRYNDEEYIITEYLPYDKHFEVLIKRRDI
jgi:hypothetical protein